MDNNDVLKVLKTIRSNTTFIGVFALVIMITTIAQCARAAEWESINETYSNDWDGEWTVHEAQLNVYGPRYGFARLFLRCVDGDSFQHGFRFGKLTLHHSAVNFPYQDKVDIDVKFGDEKPEMLYGVFRPERGKRLLLGWSELNSMLDTAVAGKTLLLRLQWRNWGGAPIRVMIPFPMAGSAEKIAEVLRTCKNKGIGKRRYKRLAKRHPSLSL